MSVKSTIRNATTSVARAMTPDKSVEQTDILDTLKREHDEVKELLEQLEGADTADERVQLVRRIKSALVPHTLAEQEVVYDAVLAIGDEAASTHGHEGYLEHECASLALDRLEAAEPGSAEHKAAAKVLKELVESHIKEEERNIWRDVRENFDEAERSDMNVAFEAAKSEWQAS